MAWKDYFIAFDCETTGFGKDARILELAIVEVVGGDIVDEWSSFFNPDDVDWSNPNVQKALEINRITLDMLDGAPRFEEVITEVFQEFNKADVWVAHNIEFDLRMLRQEFERVQRSLPEVRAHACTQCIDFKTDPNGRGWKLADLSARYGIEQQQPAHRALADAKTAGLLFYQQYKYLPDDLNEMSKFAEETLSHWRKKAKRR